MPLLSSNYYARVKARFYWKEAAGVHPSGSPSDERSGKPETQDSSRKESTRWYNQPPAYKVSPSTNRMPMRTNGADWCRS
jgi:hypothetical protein